MGVIEEFFGKHKGTEETMSGTILPLATEKTDYIKKFKKILLAVKEANLFEGIPFLEPFDAIRLEMEIALKILEIEANK